MLKIPMMKVRGRRRNGWNAWTQPVSALAFFERAPNLKLLVTISMTNTTFLQGNPIRMMMP